MLMFIISFVCGDYLLQTFRQLPSDLSMFLSVSLIVVASLVVFKKFTNSRWIKTIIIIIIGILSGLAYTNWYAHKILNWSLPDDWQGKPVSITGYIVSLLEQSDQQYSFLFLTKTIILEGKKQHANSIIKLNWNNVTSLKVGDKWKFQARLKRIHGIGSPGAFDYEALVLEKGIRASGYILGNSGNFIYHSWFIHPIDQLRQVVQAKLKTNLPTTPTAHWLEALIIGERENINADEWKVLRATGTNHLMAIAGLHIGLLAGFIHLFVTWLWRKSSLALFLPATEAGAYAAVFAALCYAALAGFSLPTQRACIMLVLYMFAFISRRHINPWYIWSSALFVVLLLNPLSILSDSFWLSFCTLALIIYGMSARIAPKGWWWKWGRVQWVIGLGLIPLSILIFQETSFISFIANSIAIPWLGFFILPLCLIGTIFLFIIPHVAQWLFLLADFSLRGLWKFLVFFSQLNLSNLHIAMPNVIVFILACGAIFLLLLPLSARGRWFALIWLLPLWLYIPKPPEPNQIAFALLDVGQGLSAVVQTQHHVLLYDAGPKLNMNNDMGENVVVPFLLTKRIKKIDMLVISHGDNDHLGGAESVAKTFTILSAKSSVPEKINFMHAQACKAGDHWQWDGVDFTFLYPSTENLSHGNDSSCVLRIDNGKQSILLPGDIEKYAEKNILQNYTQPLPISLLVAPHHGSKTSAFKPFITALQPKVTLYPIGYRNRYHFPHKSVVDLYAQLGTKTYDTATMGTMEWQIDDGVKIEELFRMTHKHYWSCC